MKSKLAIMRHVLRIFTSYQLSERKTYGIRFLEIRYHNCLLAQLLNFCPYNILSKKIKKELIVAF